MRRVLERERGGGWRGRRDGKGFREGGSVGEGERKRE